MIGTIIKNISNDYTVNCNGKHYICKPRGKFRLNNLTPLVGDIVEIDDVKATLETLKTNINALKSQL